LTGSFLPMLDTSPTIESDTTATAALS